MVAYDLLIHIIYLFGWEHFFLKRKLHFWPEWHGLKYQAFWTLFWGAALCLLLSYLFQ